MSRRSPRLHKITTVTEEIPKDSHNNAKMTEIPQASHPRSQECLLIVPPNEMTEEQRLRQEQQEQQEAQLREVYAGFLLLGIVFFTLFPLGGESSTDPFTDMIYFVLFLVSAILSLFLGDTPLAVYTGVAVACVIYSCFLHVLVLQPLCKHCRHRNQTVGSF